MGKYTNIKTRFYKEVIFDYFVSKSRILRKSHIVIFTKPAFKLSSKYCAKNNIKTIAFASILHPRFNNRIVKDEMERLAISGYSEYTDDIRTKYLSSFFSAIDHLLVQSAMVRENYIQYGVEERKIDVLNSSVNVDTEKYRPNPGALVSNSKLRVLHISNMDLIKGIDYLLAAWDAADIPNAELILGGMVKPNLKNVFDKYPMNNVSLIGYVNNTAQLYTEADIFISPSISDLNPFTVIEAMACGVPVIVSDHCGISSLIEHKVDGFVYKYNDTEELKGYINWCSTNREALKEMGRNARRKALDCSSKDVFSAIFQYIVNLSDVKNNEIFN